MNVTDSTAEPSRPRRDRSVIKEISVLSLCLFCMVFALKLRQARLIFTGHWAEKKSSSCFIQSPAAAKAPILALTWSLEGRSLMLLLNSIVRVAAVSKCLFNSWEKALCGPAHTLVSNPCRRSILCMLRSMVAWHVICSAHSARNHPLSPSRSRSPSYQPKRTRPYEYVNKWGMRCAYHSLCSLIWKPVAMVTEKGNDL